MKLYELKNVVDTVQGIPVVPIKTPPADGSSAKNVVGSGIQSTVYDFKTRPGTVNKLARLTGLDDAYLHYVALVLKHQDNPFFPRITNAKLLRLPELHSDDSYWLAVQMEKLVPLGQGNMKDSAVKILNSLGLDDDQFDKANWTQANGNFTYDAVLRSFFDSKHNREMLASRTSNPQFKEALELMEPLFRKHRSDVHDSNVMMRLTGYGPQLVFSDPLYPTSELENRDDYYQ